MMKEENKAYITGLDVRDVPWHRLTTAYGRGTDFPVYFETLSKMDDLKAVKNALYELTTNMEHQSTLWHATPFGMIFMSRILEEALNKSKENPIAKFLAGELLDFFLCILQCYHDGDEMEHAAPLLCFSDMLKGLADENYTILLSHRPELFDLYCEAGTDLVLSGHAHGGQVRIPFVGGLVAPNQGLFPEYTEGLYEKDGIKMIVSRGLGNSIIPLRVNDPPELVLITLNC